MLAWYCLFWSQGFKHLCCSMMRATRREAGDGKLCPRRWDVPSKTTRTGTRQARLKPRTHSQSLRLLRDNIASHKLIAQTLSPGPWAWASGLLHHIPETLNGCGSLCGERSQISVCGKNRAQLQNERSEAAVWRCRFVGTLTVIVLVVLIA